MKDDVSDFYGLDMLMITACFGFQEIKTLPTFVFEFVFCGVVHAAVYTRRLGAKTNLFSRYQTC